MWPPSLPLPILTTPVRMPWSHVASIGHIANLLKSSLLSPECPEECSNCKLNIRQLNLRKFCRRDYGKHLKVYLKRFCYWCFSDSLSLLNVALSKRQILLVHSEVPSWNTVKLQAGQVLWRFHEICNFARRALAASFYSFFLFPNRPRHRLSINQSDCCFLRSLCSW